MSSEARALQRNTDGTASLGNPSGWSEELRVSARLVQDSPLPACLWWGPDRVSLENEGWRRLFVDAVPKDSEARASAYRKALDPAVERAAAGQGTVVQDLSVPVGSDAEERFLSFSLTPVRDDDGRVVGIACVCMGDTSRSSAVREHYQEIRRVRHDLRTPLHAVSLGAELLRRLLARGGAADEQALSKALTRIVENIRELSVILQEWKDTHRD